MAVSSWSVAAGPMACRAAPATEALSASGSERGAVGLGGGSAAGGRATPSLTASFRVAAASSASPSRACMQSQYSNNRRVDGSGQTASNWSVAGSAPDQPGSPESAPSSRRCPSHSEPKPRATPATWPLRSSGSEAHACTKAPSLSCSRNVMTSASELVRPKCLWALSLRTSSESRRWCARSC